MMQNAKSVRGALYDLRPKPDLNRATRNINDGSNRHRDTTKDLQVHEATIISCDQRAANRRSGQSCNGDGGEETAVSDADLADVGNLGDEGGGEGDESAGGEAEEGGEDDDGHVAVGGEPQGKHYDGAEGVDYDHGVEAAEAVSDDAGEYTAKYAGKSVS